MPRKFTENIGRRLNDEGVPVVAIPLLSFDEGYYFTADNFLRAADRYGRVRSWHGDAAAFRFLDNLRCAEQRVLAGPRLTGRRRRGVSLP